METFITSGIQIRKIDSIPTSTTISQLILDVCLSKIEQKSEMGFDYLF